MDVTHGIMASAVDEVRSGKRFRDGEYANGLIEGYAAPMVAVPKAAYSGHFGLATWYYEGHGYRVLQVAWPDRAGTYPWEAGVDPHIRARQPVFGKDPYWADFDASMRSASDEIDASIRKSIAPRIAAGEYETVSLGKDGSRTIRLEAVALGQRIRVTATFFDDEEGLVRIENVETA